MSSGPTRLRPRQPAPPPTDRGPPGSAVPAAPRPARTDADVRFRARRRSLRRRRWLQAGVPLLLVALLAATAWALLGSSLLGVTTVRVSGTHRTTPALITRAAGVRDGTPLARVNLAQVQHRVEELTLVESAVVTRSWPHTLLITVVERVPAAVAQTADGRWLLVSADGFVLASAPSRPAGLALLAIDPATTDRQTLAAAAAVAGALTPSLRAKVQDVSADTPDSVQLLLRDGGVVRWGNAQDDALKAQVLAVLLTHHARVYDVTAPGFATTS